MNINNNIHAVYVHIPFCKQKCLYCDFASYAGLGAEVMESYVNALCREISLRKAEAAAMSKRATVYFGGGTPSLLSIEQLERIAVALKKYGFWQIPAEATIEVNPGTADLVKLQSLRKMGFDRLSFGVQSLQDVELCTIGRIHNAAEALEAVELAKAAGFKRISCDLIYGLPGQTLLSLKDTLERLVATGIEHVSVYGLIVEEGTPLAKLVDAGKLVLPDDDTAADMYELVQDYLREQGFIRYEISNYAKNNQYSRHNYVYWQYYSYIAFGAAACGFDGSCRKTATESVSAYIKGVAQLAEGLGADGLYSVEQLNSAELLSEYMFMNLRKAEGADLIEAKKRFGVDVYERYGDALEPFIERGMVNYDSVCQRLSLTEAGMELGNLIFEIFVTD